jgi:hypothetical protein
MSVLATILAAAEAGAEHAGEAAGGHGAEEEHKSEAPFFIIGGILASFAVIISVFGFKKPDFPGSASAARGVMALSTVLVVATMASIVYVAN